jgi:putative glutamine amidotransferase
MADRVRIGVTGPDRGVFIAWNFTRLALYVSEATAVRITPSHPADIEKLDGLVIGGGADIDPSLYGERRHIRTVHIDHKRDKMEWALLEKALAKKIPVLGICRGMQMIDIFLGGTLYPDLNDLDLKFSYERSPFPHRIVYIKPRTKLHRILRVSKCEVNSIHHQAVRKLGRGSRISAEDDNKITQAIEHETYPFLLGVQWHPEYMPQSAIQRRLFKALVDQAKKRRG